MHAPHTHTSAPIFELRGIAKSYEGIPALQPIDLSILPRETAILIGPSGCGKSTLMRVMIGLLRPDAGELLFEAGPLTQHNVRKLRQRMGYVIQDGGLFPHLTARENVTLMATHLRWNADRIHARVLKLCSLTQFPEDALHRYPSELSGGQRQRVSLMRALMLDPDVLLLDEPLGALDPMIRFELQQDLRDIFSELQKTVVMVTHDLGEAAFFGDRIILMRSGRIVQQGTLQDLLKRPANPFVSHFLRAQRSPLQMMEGKPS